MAGLSPDTLSSSLQPYRDSSDFFINTTSLAAVIQLPIKIHSIDKNYLRERRRFKHRIVENIWKLARKLKLVTSPQKYKHRVAWQFTQGLREFSSQKRVICDSYKSEMYTILCNF